MLRKGGAGKKALWLDEVARGSDKDGFRHFTNLQGRPVPHHHHPQEGPCRTTITLTTVTAAEARTGAPVSRRAEP